MGPLDSNTHTAPKRQAVGARQPPPKRPSRGLGKCELRTAPCRPGATPHAQPGEVRRGAGVRASPGASARGTPAAPPRQDDGLGSACTPGATSPGQLVLPRGPLCPHQAHHFCKAVSKRPPLSHSPGRGIQGYELAREPSHGSAVVAKPHRCPGRSRQTPRAAWPRSPSSEAARAKAAWAGACYF